LTGQGYKLFIKTTPENLRELKQILADIDVGARQLLISVSMDASALRASQGAEVTGQVAIGDSASVRAGSSSNDVSVRLHGSRQSEAAPATYQIKSSEGQWATINTGTAYPVRKRVRTAYGTEIERVEMVSANSGFQVLPLVSDQEVTLRVRPYRSARERDPHGAIEYSELDTVVRGRLGRWIPLGGATSGSSSRNSTLTGTSREESSLAQSMAVKIDLVDSP
ncbi:MAG: hypothetical protein JSW10_05545, partial [Pseudomonadota bacterium]